jgi:hypothetical protein
MNFLKIDSQGVGSSWFLASDRPLFIEDWASCHAGKEIQACRALERGATQDFVMGPRGSARDPRQARGPLGACKGLLRGLRKTQRKYKEEKGKKEKRLSLGGPQRSPEGP